MINMDDVNSARGIEIFSGVIEKPAELLTDIIFYINGFSEGTEIDSDLMGQIFLDYFIELPGAMDEFKYSRPTEHRIISELIAKNTVFTEEEYISVSDSMFSMLEVNLEEFLQEVLGL